MKKISFLGISLTCALTAFGQMQVVKDAERAMKSAPEKYPQNIEALKPAFTNPETAEQAYTWFVAGKGAFDYFDNQQVVAQMGKEVDKKALGHSLIDGYGYFQKALPLDTVVDAKGKTKTKYSKDMVKMIVGHYNDFSNAALYLWEAEDYAGAVQAWDLFVENRANPVLVKAGLKAQPDSIYGEILFNMGIGNSLLQNNEGALKNFKDAISMGYQKKNAFDYAISAASAMNNAAEMAAIAEQAYPIYGAEDSRYIGYMINNYLDKKDFAAADAMIDKYLAADPNNAQLYFVKGVVLETENKLADAKAAYKKAMELDPKNAQALFRLGYSLYQEACAIDEQEGGGLNNEEYNKLRETRINPLFREAAGYIEKSYELDDQNSDARSVLRSIYYNLNDEANLKRVEAM
ncbi:MAG: tetratricopeptide repeat protein [[Clostridium] fimetarium]|nr:tetratricopeptide repeat protein [Alistipes timonensis]MCM1405805.1 tetratricopeptide repeat protein [[Clostridium] fimetarium]